MFLVVALIVSALVAIGMQTQISNQVSLLICRIAGGDCAAQQAAVDKDCIVSSSTSKGSAAVTVAVVKVGEESTMIKTVYADGRTVFTLLKNGSVAAELIAGAKAKAGKIGFDATASASAGGKLEGAMTYTFTDPEKAKEFEDQVREHGSFGQVARDAVEGFDPFGAKDWVLDHTIGEDVDAEDLPEPDSTYVSAEAFIKGEAKAIGNVVIADAGAKGLLQLAGGARVYTSGKDKGKVELNIKVDAELAANLGLVTFGPEVMGKANFTATVTLDQNNGYQPVAPPGDRDGGVQRRPPRRGPRAQADRGADRADPGRPEGGQPQERGVRLDRRVRPAGRVHGRHGPHDRAGTRRRARPVQPVRPLSRRGQFAMRLNDKGRLTLQAYNTTTSNTEAGLKVGLGVGGGVEGAQSRDDRDLSGSWVREPGAGWAERNCGLPD